jgi:hypothetical protein
LPIVVESAAVSLPLTGLGSVAEAVAVAVMLPVASGSAEIVIVADGAFARLPMAHDTVGRGDRAGMHPTG